MDIRKTPIICYGDSNTYGYDPRSYLGDRYPRQVRWTGILKEQHRLNLINCGMPGREIPRFQYEMQQALNPMASLQPPFFLWIMLGFQRSSEQSGAVCRHGGRAYGRVPAFSDPAGSFFAPGN